MKVLHIWDQCGIGSIISKYMTRRYPEVRSCVVMRKRFDDFGISQGYGACVLNVGGKLFKLLSLLISSWFDIVHIHDLDTMIPWIKRVWHHPVVIHYHGTSIRGNWEERRKFWKWADLILVSTDDLLIGAPSRAVFLPNPIDTEMFRYQGGCKPSTAFTFSYDRVTLPVTQTRARELASRLGLELTIYSDPSRPVQHRNMPSHLSRYEYYIDCRYSTRGTTYGKALPILSKTALEALACGCKVIRWDGEIIEGLPQASRPENVVKRLLMMYKEVLDSKRPTKW